MVCYWGLLCQNSFLCKHFCSRPAEDVAKMKSKEPADAAALIAEALKRKFAHRHRCNSEQDSVEDFKLPIKEVKPQSETPLVRNICSLIAGFCFYTVYFWFWSEGFISVYLNRIQMCETFLICLDLLSSQFGQHMLKSTGKRTFL